MTITHPHTGEVKKIVKKYPDQAHRALVWMMTTDGKSTAQFIILNKQKKLFAGAILQSRMQRYDSTTAYKCYYLAIIGTPLPPLAYLSTHAKLSKSPSYALRPQQDRY
jgi:hypothetical protein